MWQPVDGQTGRALTIGMKDWPVLIHGAPKAGASFFTIALTASLLRRGEKVVFLCAHAPAIQSLQKEMHLPKPEARGRKVTPVLSSQLEDMQLVTMMQRRGFDPVGALCALRDLSERIVIVKNIDEILSSALWAVLQPHRRLMLSGDLTKTNVALSAPMLRTQILFSPTPKQWPIQRSALPTYMAEIHRPRGTTTGLVREVASGTDFSYA